jgi:hypothetical protein
VEEFEGDNVWPLESGRLYCNFKNTRAFRSQLNL